MCIGLYDVKYTLFFSDLNETEFSQKIFGKSSNIKFHEIHPVGAVFPHGQTDMMKLIITFHDFVKYLKFLIK
jgi:hypothetical protein